MITRIGRFTKYALGFLLLAAPAGASYFPVALSSAGANASTSTVIILGGNSNIGTVTQGAAGTQDWRMTLATANVFVSNLTGQTSAYVVNPTSGPVIVLVSSNTTLPATAADASQLQAMGDNQGRTVTQAGVPTAVYLTTSPTTSVAGYMVLVASPAATVFTHMCGCAFTNTSATAVQADLYPSGVVTTTNTPKLQLVAGDTRGIWPGCDKPFLNTTAGGVQVTAKISAAVSSIAGYCLYYQSTSP